MTGFRGLGSSYLPPKPGSPSESQPGLRQELPLFPCDDPTVSWDRTYLTGPREPRSAQIPHGCWGGIPTPRLTVLAGLAVEARAAMAGARGGLAGAVVVARALQAAGGSVAPSGAGCREPAGQPPAAEVPGARGTAPRALA